MIPFLVPIAKPETRIRYRISGDHAVEVTFYSCPPAPRRERLELGTDLNVRKICGGSASVATSQSSLSGGSRPHSRTKSPRLTSQPTSARSVRESPIPPAPAEVPPPPARHKNKGLETSSAMLELFGGDSAFGASSAFETIPPNPPARHFGRKNVLQKELEQRAQWEAATNPQASSCFSNIADHEMAYHRAEARAGWKKPDSQFTSEPGPEKFEDSEMELETEDVSPDPTCPAAKILALLKDEAVKPSGSGEHSPEEIPEGKLKKLSEPGPDLGFGEEEGEQAEAPGDTRMDQRRDADATAANDDGIAKDAGGMSLLIRGAQVINDDSIFAADVLVVDGAIQNVAANIEAPQDAQVIDASGKLLLPAGIDVHTHLTSADSCDDVSTGCRAALAGGTATVVDMVVPNSGESLTAAIARVQKSLDQALCNVGLSIVIRTWSESVKREMEKIVGQGVNSFIVDLGNDGDLYQVLEHCRTLGVHVRVLPENKTLIDILEKKMLELGINGPEGFLQSRPEEVESERVSSICVLSQLANCPVSILSLSSSESLAALEKARASGALSHAEVAAAAVATNGTHYFNKCLKHAAAHITDVPLRPEGGNKLIGALTSQPFAVCTSGHRAIASSSRTSNASFAAMPKGVAGVEERMAIVWEKAVRTGRIDPMRFVAITSSNAAKMFNMYPKKGRIAVGADADLVLWDTTVKRKLTAGAGQSNADMSVYEGISVHAQAIVTIVGGRVAWKDGAVKDAKGGFIALSPNCPYLFSVVQQRDKIPLEKVEREPVANGVHKKSTGESPFGDRTTQRKKSHFESNIDFGSSDNRPTASRVRNPPGGRTTGFW